MEASWELPIADSEYREEKVSEDNAACEAMGLTSADNDIEPAIDAMK